MRIIIQKLYIVFSGILMGMADTMPGISGSTITYILDTYEEFIQSLSTLFKKESFQQSFSFLLKLGIGWIIGAVISILLIGNFIEHNVYFITSLFLGFIIISIPLTFKDVYQDNHNKINVKYLLYTLLGFVTVIGISYLGSFVSLTVETINQYILYIYIFFVSLLAISSMLLPGISGSTIMLIFGLYYPIMNILQNLTIGKLEGVDYLLVMFFGCIVGIFTTARIINKFFQKNKQQSLYFIQGMLIASIFAVINAPTSLKDYMYPRLSLGTFNIFSFLLGIILIYLLYILKKIKNNNMK